MKDEFISRKRSAARAAALMAAAWAAMQTTPALAVDYYLAGDFNGWNAAGQIMALNPDGSVSATVSGLTAGSRYEFKVTDGTLAATWPPANSWLHADGAGKATITFRPNLTSDSWASDPNRIGVNNDAGTWTAVGDWQSTPFTNNDPATAMSSLGGGLYRYQATIATPGSHQYKAVNTGSWDAIGADGRSINASNWSFTTTSANQLKNLWLNSAAGTIKVADVNTWTGASDSAWNNAANWSRSVTPGTFHDVVLASSGANITIAGGSPNINSLRFDENATISGNAISIHGGAVIVAAGKSATINTYLHPRRDLVRSGAGTLTIANLDIGSAARGSFTHVQGTTNVSGDLRVVLGSGAGTLQISGGTLDVNGHGFFGESGSGAGTVQMSGGTLKVAGGAGSAWVGYGGNASFIQSGGNVIVGSATRYAPLVIAQGASAVGTYNLSGTGSLTVNGNCNVGNVGSGVFQQSGGSLVVNGDGYVGNLGSGAFEQSGGSVVVTGAGFFGYSGSGTGTVQMSGGTLQVAGDAGAAWVGYQGNANFIQSGGNVTVGSETRDASLIIGHTSSSLGTYHLSGTGSLTVNGECNVGNEGSGIFHQSGGSLVVNGDGYFGNNGGSGAFHQSGGSLVVNGDGYVGHYGSGVFQQSGGSLVVTGYFDLAEYAGSTGSYELTGGSYSIGTDSWVGGGGNATFTQTGGVATAGTNFSIAGYSTSNSSVNLSGAANFTVDGDAWVGGSDWTEAQGIGKLNISGGAMTVDGALTVYDTGPNDATGTRVNLSGGTLSVGSLNTNGNRLGFTGGTLNLNGPGASAVAGNLIISGAGNPALNLTGGALTAGSILLGSGAGGVGTMNMSAGANVTLKTGAIEIASGSKLDANDNKLIVTAQSLASIEAKIITGRNGGSWTGSGIITSMSAAQPANMLTTLAVATAGDVGYGGTRTFGGETVSPTDVLVMYTYAGDANLSGLIDGDDFFRIDQGFNSNGSLLGYANGDFNYSGNVDADDYWLIDRNYSRNLPQLSAGAPVGVTSVPEPGIALMWLLAGQAITSRRRSRRL